MQKNGEFSSIFWLKKQNKKNLSIEFYINLLSNAKSPVNKNNNKICDLAPRRAIGAS